MPSLELFVSPPDVRGLPANGNLILDPSLPEFERVLLRQLACVLLVPSVVGTFKAIVDTGSPLTLFPYDLWHEHFGWRAGRDFDELSVAGVTAPLTGQVLGHRFACRLARLRTSIELVGRNLKGDRLRLDGLVCQLAEMGGPPYVILGLWGGVFTGRKLSVELQPNSDDLQAHLEF